MRPETLWLAGAVLVGGYLLLFLLARRPVALRPARVGGLLLAVGVARLGLAAGGVPLENPSDRIATVLVAVAVPVAVWVAVAVGVAVGLGVCGSCTISVTSLAMPLAASLFLVCLAASLGSSFVLARALDRIGVRLRLTDAVIGMLTALGADAPEISTAAAAVLSKHDDIGVGVVLGSNVVNLAALLGIGALLAGRVHLGRRAAALEGATAIAVAAVAVPVAAGWIDPLLANWIP